MSRDRCGRNAHPYGWAATNRDGRTLTLCLHDPFYFGVGRTHEAIDFLTRGA